MPSQRVPFLLGAGLLLAAWLAPLSATPFGLGGSEPSVALPRDLPESVPLDLMGDVFRKQMDVYLVIHGFPNPVTLDAAGMERARFLLQQAHPKARPAMRAGWSTSGTWDFLREIRKPQVRRVFEEVASGHVADGDRFAVRIYIEEPARRLPGGTALNTPGGTETLGDHEPFWQFLRRTGADYATLVALNPERLATGAFTRILRDGTREVRVSEVNLKGGEAMQSFLSTLLHESGHVGFGGTCTDQLGYGPDRNHYAAEILSPHGALVEGWANLMASRIEGHHRELVSFEGHIQLEYEMDRAGYYLSPAAQELTLADRLANELYVARLLGELEELPPGPRGVLDAVSGSSDVACRDVTHVLKEYLDRYPGQREAVAGLLEFYARGLDAPGQIRDAMAGRFPDPVAARPRRTVADVGLDDDGVTEEAAGIETHQLRPEGD